MPFARVIETKPNFVKVIYDHLQDEVFDWETDWIQVLVKGTENKENVNLQKGEIVFVAIEYDKYGKPLNQAVIGAGYGEKETAPFDSDTEGTAYKDGAEEYYNTVTGIKKIIAQTRVELMNAETEAVRFDQLKILVENLLFILDQLCFVLNLHTHSGGVLAGALTGPPNPATLFDVYRSALDTIKIDNVKSTGVKLS